jgi:hypothetical protein
MGLMLTLSFSFPSVGPNIRIDYPQNLQFRRLEGQDALEPARSGSYLCHTIHASTFNVSISSFFLHLQSHDPGCCTAWSSSSFNRPIFFPLRSWTLGQTRKQIL